jgi:hypothetical protein
MTAANPLGRLIDHLLWFEDGVQVTGGSVQVTGGSPPAIGERHRRAADEKFEFLGQLIQEHADVAAG